MEKKLNKNQEMAVRHVEGACLVLSGPGSGKTFVLTNRIFNLIVKNNVDPENILVITFTRAAANEMKERFIKLLKENDIHLQTLPSFGTFHSIFFEILKNDFGYNNKSLMSDIEERIFLSEVLEKNKNLKVSNDLISNILRDIKAFKLYAERDESFIPRYLSPKLFVNIYNDYQEKLFDNKKLDFSDMISKCYELLLMHKDVLDYYNNRYKYILIDEFQDINKSQYDLVKLICKNKNLFVVGDDDQSIYKFRGSHPKVMNDFLKDFKSAKKIYLVENYRCARKIVKFSKMVIDKNKERFKKDLVANRKEIGKLELKAFVDSTEENKYIVDLIKKYNRQGIAYSEMAILYRTNLLSHSIKSFMTKQNIPYRVKGEDKDIYDNFAVQDIISYLRFAVNKKGSKDLLNIANKPLRYISRDAVNFKDATISDLIKYYANKDYMHKSLEKFKFDMKMISNSITPLAIRYIRQNVGYDKYLIEYCRKNDFEVEEILDIVDTFEEEAIGNNDIKKFLSYIGNIKKNNRNEEVDKDAVHLMTFHLSKGLEYKVIFIIDANDGLIPHKKSIRENDIETERRLFYVAMTRAKDYLHIFFTVRRFGKDFKASRFIVDLV